MKMVVLGVLMVGLALISSLYTLDARDMLRHLVGVDK